MRDGLTSHKAGAPANSSSLAILILDAILKARFSSFAPVRSRIHLEITLQVAHVIFFGSSRAIRLNMLHGKTRVHAVMSVVGRTLLFVVHIILLFDIDERDTILLNSLLSACRLMQAWCTRVLITIRRRE